MINANEKILIRLEIFARFFFELLKKKRKLKMKFVFIFSDNNSNYDTTMMKHY